jgi:hypothetical protein
VNRAAIVLSNWRDRGPPEPASEADVAHFPFAKRFVSGATESLEISDGAAPPEQAGFRWFETSDAPSLAGALATYGAGRQRALQWCESLMRYCEVHRLDLERRAADKWTTAEARRLGLLAIAAVLGEAALTTGDLRFANTVLKLIDRPRLFDAAAYGPRRKTVAGSMVAAHAVLACHAALERKGMAAIG